MSQKILVVEDDKTIAYALEYALCQNGYAPTVCQSLREAINQSRHTQFSLCLLDISLPDGSGLALCRQFKAAGGPPVIFLTACDEEDTIIKGLELGADDYVTKPFRMRVLLTRIRAVLRRAALSEELPAPWLSAGNVRVHTGEAKVYKNNREIPLTALEYRLLLMLLSHTGQVLSRTQLLEAIWDIAGDFVNDNTLTVYIKRLRDKLEDDPQNPSLIVTVRGLGYKVVKGVV